MMRKKLMMLLMFGAITATAQTKPAEVGIVLDNDLYVSTVNDQYYTNGVELFYRQIISHKKEIVNKKLLEFRLGQYIYNPQTNKALDLSKNDRPFAGYLFGEVGINTFYQDQSVLKIGAQLGYVGPNAFGEEFQKGFHKLFGYNKIYGWSHQIKNALAVQANVFYSKRLFTEQQRFVDFHLQAEGSLGTVFTGLSVGPVVRFSLTKLVPVYNSNLYDGALQSDKNKTADREFYFYIIPKINYQAYDATIQGSLFDDKSPVTFPLEPIRFNAEAGFKFRRNHWNLSYAFIYRSKELKNNDIKPYYYGSIGISYLLY